MKRKIITISALVLALMVVNTVTFAQKAWVNTSLGVSNYKGDLDAGYTPSFKPAFSLGASYDITYRYRLRLNFTQMSVHGDDTKATAAGVADRKLNFKTNISELSLLGEFDLLDNLYNSVIPYVFAGVGVYHFNPKPETPINGVDVNLHDLGTEGQNLSSGKYADRKYSLTQLNFQFGGGIRFELNESTSLSLEANYRRLFTDYLDDVSAGSYVPASEWAADIPSNPTAATAQQYNWRGDGAVPKTIYAKRGDPSHNDTYYTFQIRLNFRLNNMFLGDDLYSPRNPSGRGQLRCGNRMYY